MCPNQDEHSQLLSDTNYETVPYFLHSRCYKNYNLYMPIPSKRGVIKSIDSMYKGLPSKSNSGSSLEEKRY